MTTTDSQQTGHGLGAIAADIAMRAAATYLRKRNLVPTDEQYSELITALRGQCRLAITEAIADARQAFEAGMTGAGNATFSASMALAGIRAVREVFGEE